MEKLSLTMMEAYVCKIVYYTYIYNVMIRTQYHISQEDHYNMHLLHVSISLIISKHATCGRVLFTTQTHVWYPNGRIYISRYQPRIVSVSKFAQDKNKVCHMETRSFYKRCDAVCCKRFHSKLL